MRMYRFHQFSLRTLIVTVTGFALLLFAYGFRPQPEVRVSVGNDGTVILNEAKMRSNEFQSQVDAELRWRNLWLVETNILLTAESQNVSAGQLNDLLTQLKDSGVKKVSLCIP